MTFADTQRMPDTPAFDRADYPRTYRPGAARRVVALLLAAAVVAVVAFLLVVAPRDRQGATLAVLAVALVAAGLLLPLQALRTRIVLHADRVERTGLFGSRSLALDEIASWRAATGRAGEAVAVRLQPREGRRRVLVLPLTFDRDDAWHAWFARVPCSDDADREAGLARVRDDPRLGATPEARERTLRVAQVASGAVQGAVIIAAIAASALSWHVVPVALAALCLPAIAFTLAAARPSLFTLQMPWPGEVRASLAGLVWFGAVMPLLIAFKVLALAQPWAALVPAIPLAAIVAALALRTDPALRRRRSVLLGTLLASLLHGAALAAWLNHVLPPRADRAAVATVQATRSEPAGRIGRIWEVWLGPAATASDWRSMRVPEETWRRMWVGAPACLDEREGLLGFEEATLRPCTRADTPGAPLAAEEAAHAWLEQRRLDDDLRVPLVRRLVAGDWAGVDDELQALQRRYESGEVSELDVDRAWRTLEASDPAIDAPLADWLAQRPGSYAAHLFAAMHARLKSARLRMGGYVDAASPGFGAERFEDVAMREIERAKALSPRPVEAIAYEAGFIRDRRDPKIETLMRQAVALDPEDVLLRRSWLSVHPLCPCIGVPKSDPTMDALLASNTTPGVRARLQATRLLERSLEQLRRNDRAGAAEGLRQVLASDPAAVDFFDASISLARLETEDPQQAEAGIARLRTLAQTDPYDWGVRRTLGWALEIRHRSAEALAAYLDGARLGDAYCAARAGMLQLYTVPGIRQDIAAGARWLRIAADRGDDDARKLLREHPELMAARR